MAAAAAMAMALAACGGGGSGGSSGGTTTNGLIKIRVGSSPGNEDATPFFAAQAQGFFKKNGLDVSETDIAGGDTATAAELASKSLDVVIGNASEWIGDIAKKSISGKIIGEYTDQNYVIVARKGITDVSQLKGKTIGISSVGGGDQIYNLAVLSHSGIKSGDIKQLALGGTAARIGALESGRIDATELPTTTVPDELESRIILTGAASPVKLISGAIFARQDLIDSQGAALKKFVTAMGQAADWVRANPKAAVAACQKTGSTAASCAKDISIATGPQSNAYTWSSTCAINLPAVQGTLSAVAALVPQVKGLTEKDVADTSFAGTKP
ncbi:hypothetical protein RVR_8715 [Actinacidiphila reveromycinica]|uniref:Solute-binding protein family 3/N-terminal domain-containing protein n=1 Tax=Actinacidiphila reveromycinica TaxID=659352 RepID=A0A7U3VS04_9ACTN|nr:ABC transporter substrate-binding protein [Streptomyces sp. SN-593]BBB01346.1 hypothetical protein RVR_8715 [Streptomyces sp. SN-593]